MATDYRSALIDQLDPTQKKPNVPGGFDLQNNPAEPGGFAGPAAQGTPMPPPTSGPIPSGPLADAPAAAPAGIQGPAPGRNAGQRPVVLGFDTDKLLDPNSGSAAGSKYTKAAKTFAQGLSQDVGLSRGGLGNMVQFAQANGFNNAKAVGDDKIDFGDGNGPIDVIRGGDNSIVFQNTTSNPVWEQQYGHGGGGGGSTDANGSQLSPVLQGNPMGNIQSALSQYGQPSDLLQQLLAKLQGAA